jgi:glycerophosphoryl diester phosphodiesterase
MDSFLKIAHRGYSSKYPENTMPAFEQAAAAGADMIELDIRLSRDGRLVVIHDETIDRTSNGTGTVAELTLEGLRRHSFNNGMAEAGRVEIPTLDEVIAWASDRVTLNIEIKNDPVRNEGIEEKLAALLSDPRFAHRVVVSSFDREALVRLKRIAPMVRIGMLYGAVRPDFEDEVQTLGAYSVHPGLDAVDPDHWGDPLQSDKRLAVK